MSYILEALKKAQAERQLGSAPTIHALPIHAAPEAGAAARRLPLIIGALLLALAGAAALLFWPAPVAPVVVLAPAPVPPSPSPSASAPPVVVAAPVPAPVPLPAPPPATVVKPKPKPAAPAAAAAPAPAPEDSVPFLRGLPEAIQREVPEIAIGGYIYSKNPADSLLLIDKVLRREGDEIKPGLTLEKLLPKAAIMNYRGYRYRVPY